jgi:protein-tyrosine phosphatase
VGLGAGGQIGDVTDDDWRSWRPTPDQPLSTFNHANASFVTPYLAIGGDLDTGRHDVAVGQLDELSGAGISHIIDARVEWSDEEWVRERAAGVEYLHIGIDDDGQRIPDAWFEEGVGFAVKAIESGGVVLTHCHMGINRGPSMGFAILLALGWDAAEALQAIHGARPIAFIAYAEDALWWHHGGRSSELEHDLRRLEKWRSDHDLDMEAVIRKVRSQE